MTFTITGYGLAVFLAVTGWGILFGLIGVGKRVTKADKAKQKAAMGLVRRGTSTELEIEH